MSRHVDKYNEWIQNADSIIAEMSENEQMHAMFTNIATKFETEINEYYNNALDIQLYL